jgi:DNA repair protein SbcC/Rad50
MIFKRLLGRKRERTPAPKDQDDLIRIVRSNQEPVARREACRQIERLPELRDIASSDADSGVRDVALARYRNLLCGQEDGGPALSQRLDEIAALEDQRILEQLAADAQEVEVRGAAIAKIANPDTLANCALNDALATNRSAAVELIDDKQALDRVIKNIGKKDKRVYRAARRKLKEIVEREALPERIRNKCEELCEKLKRLGRFENWVQDRAVLDLLDRQWEEIAPEANQELGARYQHLRDRFLLAYEAYRSEHDAQVAAEEAHEGLRAERRALLEELQSLATLGDEAKISRDLEQIALRWNGLDPLPKEEQASLERELSAFSEKASLRLQELRAIGNRTLRMHELLQKAEKALTSTKPLDGKQARSWMDEAKSLLDAKGADKTAATGFIQAREALDERLLKQKKNAEQRLTTLPAKLDELTGAIDNGSLKEAEPLYRSIAASIELVELSGLPRKSYADAAVHLKSLAPRIRDLQKWRRWGADQTRQELCGTMEELILADVSLEALSLRLRDLQMEWKELDKSGSPVNHPLWDRFHAASERVYERCKPHFDAQAGEREANRKQREQICRDLEEFLARVDWERMDWRKAVRAEREMRQAWSSVGPVEGRNRKELEKRFRGALKRLDGHLAEERSRNQALKRELIAGVEALVEEPDLGRAIDETKRLQREWHTSVSARQKDENRLWQRFRAACDAVFARRQEQQDAYATELTENLKQREDICLEAENLASSDAGVDALTCALQELNKRWRDSETLPVPRQKQTGLTKRWREALSGIERCQRERLEEQRRKELDLLADQAALCERLERVRETQIGPEPALAEVAADWQALPKQHNPDLQTAIERRFNRALEAHKSGGDKLDALRSNFAADGERRAELCLQLEILAQVDSPADLVEARLQFQVTRLTERMREGEKDPLEATSRLLREWYLCGPAPEPVAGPLEERFLRARRAIEKAGRDNAAI